MVLVTGVAGFIGSFLARHLLNLGMDVVGIDNLDDFYSVKVKEFNLDLIRDEVGMQGEIFEGEDLRKVTKLFRKHDDNLGSKSSGQFHFRKLDICDYKELAKLFDEFKIEKVVHLAALASVPESKTRVRDFTKVNVDGTVNLMEVSAKCGVQNFVFASSSSVYGNMEEKLAEEEDNILHAASVYGATKVAGEVLAHSFNNMFGLPIVINRIFGPIYGPLQRPKGMFVQRAINYLYNDKTLKIYGRYGLDTSKDMTYIDDQIDGIVRCMNYKKKSFEVFNIGTSDARSIGEWLGYIEDSFGKKIKMEIIESDKGDVVSSADISKAARLLEFTPKISLKEGIERQVEVFQALPEWYKGLEEV